MHMLVDLNEEPLAKLEGLRKLFSQMPHALQKLGKDGRDLFRVTIQLIAPAGKRSTLTAFKKQDHEPNREHL